MSVTLFLGEINLWICGFGISRSPSPMWVGIIQFWGAWLEQKGVEAGINHLFPASLLELEHLIFPCPQMWFPLLAPLVLRSWDLAWITALPFLRLQLADSRLWDTTSTIAWPNWCVSEPWSIHLYTLSELKWYTPIEGKLPSSWFQTRLWVNEVLFRSMCCA